VAESRYRVSKVCTANLLQKLKSKEIGRARVEFAPFRLVSAQFGRLRASTQSALCRQCHVSLQLGRARGPLPDAGKARDSPHRVAPPRASCLCRTRVAWICLAPIRASALAFSRRGVLVPGGYSATYSLLHIRTPRGSRACRSRLLAYSSESVQFPLTSCAVCVCGAL